ncbi:hypothetical protein [Aromatoleum evansii]|uniref:hypothetical protein n=1 Tax=Aromatoleum evansii TaxID=59406 RepID=UPI00145C63EB|nr:hypothetical protein [Aromatoleum evansii]NMG32369.1 hypothetical protein [Aromatoleum evansii]
MNHFYVTLTAQVVIPNGRQLFAGDDLLIDPNLEPTEKSLVLVGSTVEPWDGQSDIRGVVVRVSREVN